MTAADPAGSSPWPAIEVRDLRRSYGGREVLRGVSLVVHRGELVALLGPNGAGKTTTVEIIEGYRARDAGTIRVLGLDPARDARAIRARLGLMLQDGGVHPRMTPHDALHLVAALYRSPADVDALVGLLGLDPVARTPYRRLSGGERQRTGIALALVGRPEVLVLDEPTAGLDPEGKVAVRRLIGELRDAGMAVLLTTHDLADVERLADRVAVLDQGRIVADAAPADLAPAVPSLRVRTVPPLDVAARADLASHLAAHGGPVDVIGEGRNWWRITGSTTTPALVAAVATWCAARDVLVTALDASGGSLEDRYLELVGHAERDPLEDSV